MKLLLLAAFLLASLSAFAQPAPTNSLSFTVANLATNSFTNLVSVLRVEGIDTPCPECGKANHHERRVESVETFYIVTATIVAGGQRIVTGGDIVTAGAQTNAVALYQSPKTSAIVTNIYLRTAAKTLTSAAQRRQPGQTVPVPPLP